jgi:hypothetical protein
MINLAASVLILCFGQQDFDREIKRLPKDSFNIHVYESYDPSTSEETLRIYYEIKDGFILLAN